MTTTRRWFSSLLLAVPALITGCAERVVYRDEEHGDEHRWNADEDRRYRQYLSEKREDYRDFNKRNKDEQADYWKWRHSHN